MLIQDQVTVFQWLVYIKYGGPTPDLSSNLDRGGSLQSQQ
jgi:hypothetical protein